MPIYITVVDGVFLWGSFFFRGKLFSWGTSFEKFPTPLKNFKWGMVKASRVRSLVAVKLTFAHWAPTPNALSFFIYPVGDGGLANGNVLSTVPFDEIKPFFINLLQRRRGTALAVDEEINV